MVLFNENKSQEVLFLSFGALPAVRTKCVKSMARAFMNDERKLEDEKIINYSVYKMGPNVFK